MSVQPRTFQEAEVALAESLPGYESRPQQQTLAAAVETALADGRHLLAEAGCGTGKSLGYLIPAILSGRRVIVSTATKALQDQIADKDLPFLQDHLGVTFTWALLKGRSNYICFNRAATADSADVPNLARMRQFAASQPADWAGDRESFPFEIDFREWAQVCSDTDDCGDLRCKDDASGSCYATNARKRAKAASVVVVNHALFLTDLKVKEMTEGAGGMLDEYHAVVFDEAHEIEEYASSALGAEFREVGVRAMVTEVSNFARRHLDPETAQTVLDAAAAVLTAVTDLWSVLTPGRIRSATMVEAGDQFVGMANALIDLSDLLSTSSVLDKVPTHLLADVRKKKDRVEKRATGAARRFYEVVSADFDDLVRWVEEEKNKRGETYLALKTAPVHVGPYLRANLFSTGVTAILASATMSVDGKFDYIAGRLGIDAFDGIDVGTPFDFPKQALLYVPTHLPEPARDTRAAWSSMMAVEVADLIKASDGRALLLFTSNKEMRACYDAIARRLPYTVLMQGQGSNKDLAAQFAADTHSVLFATRSFMTGVDFQGETCSLVIIDKLPFPVPTEPVVEARCDAIKKAGGSDFKDYTIPVMSLILKQAFGRLIRHRQDRGVVAILDPRLKSKGYGKTILNSLPPATVVTEIGSVEEFFQEAA